MFITLIQTRDDFVAETVVQLAKSCKRMYPRENIYHGEGSSQLM